jgi:hypothetical protein
LPAAILSRLGRHQNFELGGKAGAYYPNVFEGGSNNQVQSRGPTGLPPHWKP